MARPWYSFYPADYGRDTGHLTLLEHGAYRVLMDHYYATEAPLPDDEARLLHLARARTAPEKRAVRHVLAEFFQRGDGGWRHKRIDAEIAKAVEISARASFAARIGVAKRQRALGGEAAESQPSQSPSQSPSLAPSQESDSSFEEFWLAFPRKEARGPAVKAWARALEMAAPGTLIAAAKAYAAQRTGQDMRFTRLPATWLAQECWLDDAPPSSTSMAADEGEAARAWNGSAAPLVAEIGAAAFNAYFGSASFAPGPTARIAIAKPHLRALIARRFSGALKRVFGEFTLEET